MTWWGALIAIGPLYSSYLLHVMWEIRQIATNNSNNYNPIINYVNYTQLHTC